MRDKKVTPEQKRKLREAMSILGQLSASKLTKEERRARAKKAIATRWEKRKRGNE